MRDQTVTQGGSDRKGYRPREIARLYGLAPSTVYAAIYRDELKAFRKGRAVIVLADEVDRWLGVNTEVRSDAVA